MASLGDAMPGEIKRVTALKAIYESIRGPGVIVEPQIAMMSVAIEEGVSALASGDVLRIIRAYEELKGRQAMTAPILLADQIACVEREIAMRRAVYANRVRDRKMSQDTADTADTEIGRMEAVLHTLLGYHALVAISRAVCDDASPNSDGALRFREAVATVDGALILALRQTLPAPIPEPA